MSAVLQGSLASFKLPEVLTFLETTRKSGMLTVADGKRAAHVFISEGSLVYAGSTSEELRLSAILLRKKKITREQYERIDALMRSSGARFGEVAIAQGALTDAQLRDFLKVQVSEILYDAFLWYGGTFAFSDDAILPSHAVTIAVDLSNLIMEGARRIAEWEQCVRLLPDDNAVYRVVSNPKMDGKISLSVDEWKILFLINGRRTLAELANDVDDEPLHVYRVVYGLLSNQLIEGVPQEQRSDDTNHGQTAKMAPLTDEPFDDVGPAPATGPLSSSDETYRQPPAVFHAESTIREVADDTNLLVSSDARLSYKDVVRPTVAQLTIANGDAAGAVIPLAEPEYLIGRQRDNNIQLTDLGISGFHARIYRGPEGYAIEDLKSRNGTFVNGTRVFHAVLHNGDTLRLGATDLAYQVLYDVKPAGG